MKNNPISQIFVELSNFQLKGAIWEIQEAEKTGVYGNDSLIRGYARRIGEITGMDVSSNLLAAQIGVMKEASYRFIQLVK
jgi:hypothetical protein